MLYISGPMTGVPASNFPAFEHCAATLRAQGLRVISPHEHSGQGEEGEAAWNAFLRADIAAMMACDAIVLLPGWSKSKGARLELSIALALSFTVWLWDGQQLVGFEAAETECRHGVLLAHNCNGCSDSGVDPRRAARS